MPSAVDTKTEVELKGFSISESVLTLQTVNHFLTALEGISEAGSALAETERSHEGSIAVG